MGTGVTFAASELAPVPHFPRQQRPRVNARERTCTAPETPANFEDSKTGGSVPGQEAPPSQPSAATLALAARLAALPPEAIAALQSLLGGSGASGEH